MATKSLTFGDAVAIKNQISLIKSVSPNVDGPIQVIYGNQNWFTRFRGVSPEYFDIKRWYVDQGAVFSQEDVDRAAEVCVIGRTVREQLFGVEDPVGKVMRVTNVPCKIVATLLPKGLSVSGQDEDDVIFFCAVVYGKTITSSSSCPETERPLGSSVATILHGRFVTRMTLPIGSSTPNNCSRTVRPMTQTSAARSTSSGEKNAPWSTYHRLI